MRRRSIARHLLIPFAFLIAACGSSGNSVGADADASRSGPESTPGPDSGTTTVGLLYDAGGRGDLGFNDAAFAGLDRSAVELGVEVSDTEPDAEGTNREPLLRALVEQGHDLIVGVGAGNEDPIEALATEFPDQRFAVIDGFVDPDEYVNVASVGFATHEGSYLVGAAAALHSQTGRIGFIGGVETAQIRQSEAGFSAGAKVVNPEVDVAVRYISLPPDFGGFENPGRAKELALALFNDGADVIYHVAESSGAGVFEAAVAASIPDGPQKWAIGVNTDQALSTDEPAKSHILTSMLKRVDVAVFKIIEDQTAGSFRGGGRTLALDEDGVGYSTTGRFVDGYVDRLESLKGEISEGRIVVPTVPEGLPTSSPEQEE